GHLPFSHAAERLLPEGVDHETITLQIVLHDEELQGIWKAIKVHPEDVAKLATPGRYGQPITGWEGILSEIITSDFFGADRMDYLLRDSHHTGVAYGKFDHHRLIDTLRILPKRYEETEEPALGVEEGGLHTAESLLVARYLMFTQLYYHPVRRIYDVHLKDFF